MVAAQKCPPKMSQRVISRLLPFLDFSDYKKLFHMSVLADLLCWGHIELPFILLRFVDTNSALIGSFTLLRHQMFFDFLFFSFLLIHGY